LTIYGFIYAVKDLHFFFMQKYTFEKIIIPTYSMD
jgi:hypothetical protein